ncbi:MAG: hypothetical protein ACQEQ6_04765, partial [Pseudomonadota bacterium]
MPNAPVTPFIPWLRLRRWGLVVLVLATSIAGCTAMLRVTGGLPWVLQAVLFTLFALTFTWISLAFWSALCGF